MSCREAWPSHVQRAVLQAHHSPGCSRLARSQDRVCGGGACVVLPPKTNVYHPDKRPIWHHTRLIFSTLELVFSVVTLGRESLFVAGGVW